MYGDIIEMHIYLKKIADLQTTTTIHNVFILKSKFHNFELNWLEDQAKM